MRIVTIEFLTLVFSLMLFGQTKAKNVTIKGTVVASFTMSPLIGCYHVCGLSLVVRLDKQSRDGFVVVIVEYMDDHSRADSGMPSQLIEKAARWKFEASLEPDRSFPLQQYLSSIDQNGKDISKEISISAWKLLKGAENELLPYGKQIPSYRVRPGKFKSIN